MTLKPFHLLLAVQLATPAFGLDLRYRVAARSEMRSRSALPGDLGTGATFDLELSPSGEITLGSDTTFLLQYAPVLLWREPHAGGQLLPLHRGRLAFGHRWRQATLLLSQEGAHGIADVGSLRQPDGSLPSGVGEVQTLGGIPYLRSATLLGLEARPGDHLALGFAVGFTVSGSIEDVTALPLQYGPTGVARARWGVSRIDGLTTTAQLSAAYFVTGQEQLVAQLTETWDRQLSRSVLASVGAGAALTREVVVAQQGIPGTYLEVLPVGLASLSWRERLAGQPLRIDTSFRLAPFADRFTGFVYERLEGRAQGEWRPGRDWLALAAAGGALAVPIGGSEQAGDRLIFGEGTLTWTAQAWLVLQASARVVWTEQPRLGTPGQLQAVGTISVSLHEEDSLSW